MSVTRSSNRRLKIWSHDVQGSGAVHASAGRAKQQKQTPRIALPTRLHFVHT